MNDIHVNLEVKTGMNVSTHLHYGLISFPFIQFMNEKINRIYMFVISKTSIKIMDEHFILSLNFYQ
jgi:hypothetical protein